MTGYTLTAKAAGQSGLSGSASASFAVNPSRVTAADQSLALNGQPYRAIGFNVWRAAVNSWALGMPTGYYVGAGTTLADSLTAINAGGLHMNVFRFWAVQQCTVNNGVRNWSAIDKALSVADATGWKTIPVLIDEWNYDGQVQKDSTWFSTGYASTVLAHDLVPYRAYVSEFMARYAGDPRIAWLELVNEPGMADNPANVNTIANSFVEDVGGLIKAADPGMLVSTGTAGGGFGFQDSNWLTQLEMPVCDLGSYHDYTGAANAGATQGGTNGLNGRTTYGTTAGKPVYVGECGIHLNTSPVSGSMTSRASYLQAKMTDAFSSYRGVVGYLPWQFDLRGVSGSGDDYVYGPGDPALAIMSTYAT